VNSRKECAAVLLPLLLAAAPLLGQTNGTDTGGTDTIVIDEEALFGEPAEESEEAPAENGSSEDASELVEELEATETQTDSLLLTSPGVEIGGRYGFSATGGWFWEDALFGGFGPPERSSLAVELGADLFFDARPSRDARVFGKASLTYPFDDAGGSRSFDEAFHVKELFSDFHWKEVLFFRGGKHTLNWGVGTFFSPADLLNVTEIDPRDPEAEREGPVSLRANLPLNVHNLYLYLTADSAAAVQDIGLAARAEVVLGSVELGAGAFYQREAAPSAMATLSAAAGDVDLFAETVLRYGSDRTFLVESATAPLGIEPVLYDDTFFFHATAGLAAAFSFDRTASSLALAAQYYYNGEGYADTRILADNEPAVLAYLGSGDISAADLSNTGRHYAAASASWTDIGGSPFTARLFWMQNLSDMSGLLRPVLSVKLFDRITIGLAPSLSYGDAGAELSPNGSSSSLEIGVEMGGSSF